MRSLGTLASILALAVGFGGAKVVESEHALRSGRDAEQRGMPSNCPTGSAVLQVQSQSDIFLGNSSMGGFELLRYVCGWTKAPVEAPSGWVMGNGPNGQRVNVTIYKNEYRTFPVCCPGYVRNEEDICVPKCKGECVNGLCTSPGKCQCFDGFTLNDLGNCVVTCPCGCPYGECSGNRCTCNPGYALDSSGKVCNPVCEKACERGDCVSPNNCSCNHGYKKHPQRSHVCVPHCDDPCENGTCTAPDICSCDSGYYKSQFKCLPHCTSCQNGRCVKPYTCVCHNGYGAEHGKCEPVCDSLCVNAKCTAPNMCTCHRGYVHSTAHMCVPRCFPSCINAECVTPNVCQCNPGYIKKKPHKCVFDVIGGNLGRYANEFNWHSDRAVQGLWRNKTSPTKFI